MTSTAGASGIAALCLVLVVAGIVSSQASGATYFLPAGVTADGVVARVGAACLDEIDSWAERVLTAASAEEVVANGDG